MYIYIYICIYIYIYKRINIFFKRLFQNSSLMLIVSKTLVSYMFQNVHIRFFFFGKIHSRIHLMCFQKSILQKLYS